MPGSTCFRGCSRLSAMLLRLDNYHRALFKVSRRIDIGSWHLLAGSRERPFLRDLVDELLADAAPGISPRPRGGSSHRFIEDRIYFLRRPAVPGTFDAGVATVRRAIRSARVVLGLFEPKAEEPVLLYAVDIIPVDLASRPAAPRGALAAALEGTRAPFDG